MKYRNREEVMELVAKIYDRLDNDADYYGRGDVLDAVLIVEIDTGERVPVPHDVTHQRYRMPTVVLLESTTERTTIERGLLDFARENMWGYDEEDE